ncbi:MAG: preprotein translocase subunit SecG [Planctomycetes bacterium]|nr:preprotein translocase subunit SecG [Planctomycetota bacterium]
MTALVRFGLGFFLVFSALFLIALVLIQRGRGGGLAGAFGGAGGQSAFGTKAGDVFTRITVIVAACWILLCILAINVLGRRQSLFNPTLGTAAGQAVPAQSTLPPAGGPDGGATGGGAPVQPAAPSDAPATTSPSDAAGSATPAAPAAASDTPAAPAAAAPVAEAPAATDAK